MSASDTSLDAAITEVKRELHMRARVFPGWVDKGFLTQEEADRRVRRLETALQSLYELRALKAPTLFDQT